MNTHVIYKYELQSPMLGDTKIKIPADSILVAFGLQTHPDTRVTNFCVWMKVDPDRAEMEEWRFRVVPTGGKWNDSEWHHAMTEINASGHVWNLLQGWSKEPVE